MANHPVKTAPFAKFALIGGVALIALTVFILLNSLNNTIDKNTVKGEVDAEALAQNKAVLTAVNIKPIGEVTLSDGSGAAPSATRSGEDVYKTVCAACHNSGAAGAPKIDDKAAWEPRVANGFEALLNTAINGKGAMPARGGQKVPDDELTAAIAYMTKKAGFSLDIPKAAVPATEEKPAETAAPATEEKPAETTAPATEEKPAETAAPATEEKPAETAVPATEEKPAETAAPATEEKPAETAAPATEEKPAETAVPATEEKPAETAAPVTEEKPVETAAPVTEEKPAETAAPVIEEKPVETAAPVTEEKPVEAAAPTTEEKPAEATTQKTIDGEALYKTACFACHDTGAANAPKITDKALWQPRIALGKEALYNSAINGKAAMPPKGGNASLSDDEIKTIVDYMVSVAK